jgi:hypothetical protein
VPGVRIGASAHYFGAFDLASRSTVHPGTVGHEAGLDLVRPARPPTSVELELLDAVGDSAAPALRVFTVPAILREPFSTLDPDELPGAAGAPPSSAWRAFADEFSGFLSHARVPLPSPHRLVLHVADPSAPWRLLGPGPGLAALDAEPPGSATPAAPVAVHANLGECACAAVFSPVPLPAMAARLHAAGAPDPGGLAALATAYAARHPRSVWVRIALAPGEGVFAPLGFAVLDVDPVGAADLVVTLSAVPGA